MTAKETVRKVHPSSFSWFTGACWQVLVQPSNKNRPKIIGRHLFNARRAWLNAARRINDRSDAVNLARNLREPNSVITRKGIMLLVQAVLEMDAALQQGHAVRSGAGCL